MCVYSFDKPDVSRTGSKGEQSPLNHSRYSGESEGCSQLTSVHMG